MKSLVTRTPEATIGRTLQTALLIDGFWERWLVHGIDPEDMRMVRRSTVSIEKWVEFWSELAQQKKWSAESLLKERRNEQAEKMYRLASLYYNLNYWIYPTRNEEKQRWYNECVQCFQQADSLSSIETRYEFIQIENGACIGRVRVPDQVKGCIIIVNPIDSSKEELYTYEMDFLDAGFATVSFDGPGQGETYTFLGLTGTKSKWEKFIHQLIDCTAEQFPDLPIYLFGTSLGASWALFGSSNPAINKTVAVSPAVDFESLRLPAYFLDRMNYSCTLDPIQRAIPNYNALNFQSPVVLFHGKKDLMVKTEDMYRLYNMLQENKKMIFEYEGEGHCCNYKLGEIRKIAIRWFNNEEVLL